MKETDEDVAKPLAQFRAGRDVFQPAVDSERVFLHATRLQMLDQELRTVAGHMQASRKRGVATPY